MTDSGYFDTLSSRNTDVAALAAGVVAASVAMFVEPGPYDVVGAIVGLSLFMVIMTYVVGHDRKLLQSTAVGAVIALTLLPVVGFFYEREAANIPFLPLNVFLNDVDPVCVRYPWGGECRPASRMDDYPHFWAWLIITALATAADKTIWFVGKARCNRGVQRSN